MQRQKGWRETLWCTYAIDSSERTAKKRRPPDLLLLLCTFYNKTDRGLIKFHESVMREL